MAEEKPSSGGPVEMAILVFGAFVALVALWYWNGGASRADLRGIFLNPPAPVGQGDAYGPDSSSNAPQQ